MKKVTNYVSNHARVAYKQKSIDQILLELPVQDYLKTHQKGRDFVEDNWMIFYNYTSQLHDCDHCMGIETCKHNMKGYQTFLDYKDDKPVSYLSPCHYQQDLLERENVWQYLTTNFPNEFFKHDLKGYFNTLDSSHPESYQSKLLAINELLQHIEQPTKKGLYLYGDSGVGKSTILSCFALSIATAKKTVGFISVPRLISQLRSNFNSERQGDLLEPLVKLDYLILDDLGQETLSAWSRDEILYNLIQSRSLLGLPTYYTSMYDKEGLAKHYRSIDKDDKIRSLRLVNLILQTTLSLEMKGQTFF